MGIERFNNRLLKAREKITYDKNDDKYPNINYILIDVHHIIYNIFNKFSEELNNLIREIIYFYSEKRNVSTYKNVFKKLSDDYPFIIYDKSLDDKNYDTLTDLTATQKTIDAIKFYPTKKDSSYTMYLEYICTKTIKLVDDIILHYKKDDDDDDRPQRCYIFFDCIPKMSKIKEQLIRRINNKIMIILDNDITNSTDDMIPFALTEKYIKSKTNNTPPPISYGSELVIKLYNKLIDRITDKLKLYPDSLDSYYTTHNEAEFNIFKEIYTKTAQEDSTITRIDKKINTEDSPTNNTCMANSTIIIVSNDADLILLASFFLSQQYLINFLYDPESVPYIYIMNDTNHLPVLVNIKSFIKTHLNMFSDDNHTLSKLIKYYNPDPGGQHNQSIFNRVTKMFIECDNLYSTYTQNMCILYNIFGNDFIPRVVELPDDGQFKVDNKLEELHNDVKKYSHNKDTYNIIIELLCNKELECVGSIDTTVQYHINKGYTDKFNKIHKQYTEKEESSGNIKTVHGISYLFTNGVFDDKSIIQPPKPSSAILFKSPLSPPLLSGGTLPTPIINPWISPQEYTVHDKMYDAITKSPILDPTPKILDLQFYAPPEEIYTNQYKLINIDGKNDFCYPDTTKTVEYLLKNGANPNVVANGNETPLSIAIDLQNVELVELLLKNGAKKKHKNGMNMYDYCCEHLHNTINSSPFMNIDNINEELRQKMLLKAPEIKTILPKSDLIIKYVSYLFAHQISSNANHYPNMWDKDTHKKIYGKDVLTLDFDDRENYPIEYIDNIEKYFDNYATIKDYVKDSYDEMTELVDLLLRLKNAKTNVVPHTAIYNEIIGEIDKIKKKIRYIRTRKQNITNTLPNRKQINLDTKSSNIVKTYEDFFNKYKTDDIPKQYKGYTRLLKKLLNKNNKDNTQIVVLLSKHIYTNKQPHKECINKFYEKILYKYSTDFFELPQYYIEEDKTEDYFVSNYALKQVFEIMVHVFKHIISLNFISLITRTLINITGRSIEDVNDLIQGKPENKDGIEQKSFIEKCFNEIPKQIIKVITKIAEPSEDKKQFTSVSKIYEELINSLYNIKTIRQLDIKEINLKDKVLDYITAYTEIYVSGMYSFITSQMKSFLVQRRYLQMLQLLEH
uniref:Uncharacterized protein n=1 Tax=viral metagenome TaxID=1070528 RepID=A0A6C0DZN6_9ZZZZ